jgi:8-hydroxy-5-deazaflavin:NADPH oxidoreductase
MQTADIKRVGIIGAGRIGQVMAQIAVRGGRQVVISNRRGPESLSSVVQELGEGSSPGQSRTPPPPR